MALSDKDILITPNIGQAADPKIEFKGADASVGAQTIALNVYPTSNGTLSFEGSAGQLFSITNDLTGTLFSVNDVSGMPSIEVNADGTISLAEFSGNVGIGTSSPDAPLTVRQSAPLGTGVSVASVNIIAEHLDTSSGVNFLDFHYYGGGVGGSPFIRAKKARGSVASPTIVANNEVTARIGGMGYDGSNFIDNALIRFMVNGTPSLNNMPGSIEFWTTTTTALTQKMIINAAGNVGIGTSSPSAKLTVSGGGVSVSGFSAGNGSNLEIGYDGSQAVIQGYNRTSPAYLPVWIESSYVRFGTNGSEKVRIDTSGNVGIGTSAPLSKLHVSASTPTSIGSLPSGTTGILDSSGNNYLLFRNTADNATYSGIAFQDNNIGGYVIFGNAGGGGDLLYVAGYGGGQLQYGTSNTIDRTARTTVASWNSTGLQINNGDMRAPIYYDSDNTTYYTNPSNTSVMLSLDVRGEIYLDGWFRNDTIKLGLYNTATGQHFYSDDDDYWNIAGGTTANGLRFRDEHDGTIRGYVYANNANEIGFLDSDANWAIKHVRDSRTEFYVNNVEYAEINADYLTHTSDIRTPIFYDSNNTGYYVDPNSTSNINSLNVVTINRNPVVTLSGDVTGSATMTNLGSITITTTIGDNSHEHDNTTLNLYKGRNAVNIDTYDANSIWGCSIDTSTSYGTKPTSYVNVYNLPGNGTSEQTQFASYYGSNNNLWVRTRSDGTNNWLSWERVFTDTYHPNVTVNNNDTDTTYRMVFHSSNALYSTANIYCNPNIDALYATKYYDANDTGYYADPNSTSVLNYVTTRRLKFLGEGGDSGITGNESYAIYQEGGAWTWPYPDLRIAFHTGIKFGANASYQGMRFYTDYDMSTQVMSVNNGSDPLGAGNVYVNLSLQADSSLRAPIFYDSNDTNYYADPASNSRFNTLQLTNSNSYIKVGGAATPTTTLDTSRPQIEIGNGQAYPHLTLFSSGTNTSHGGVISFRSALTSGFRRWGIGTANLNPGVLGIGYADNNDNPHYGLASVGPSRWTIDTSGNSVAVGSHRAPIFYDLDNTNYYLDPNGSSNLLTLTATRITDVFIAPSDIRNNLGNPTVEEKALFHGQFNNKFRFIAPTLQEESTDGTTWVTSTRASSNQLKDMMIGEGQNTSFSAIPAGTIGTYGGYRLTWDVVSQVGYVFLNYLYVYNSASGNTITCTIEAYHNTNGWTVIAGPSTFGNWPGHTTFKHNTIGYSNNASQYSKVRVTFSSTRNAYTNAFDLYAIEWFGGYPAARRNVEYYDRDKNVFFPSSVYAAGDSRAPIFYDSDNTAYYTNPASKSELSSLDLGYTTGQTYNTAVQGVLFFNSHNESDIQGYSIGTTLENYGGNYTKLTIDWHTGIKIGAYHGYGGIRFYNNSVKSYGGTEVFSVARGDEHVRVENILYVGSSARAPIFYDSGNTAYYTDPAGTSNLNGLTVAGTITGSITGNAGTVTNGVYTNTTQTISGTKTFSSTANHYSGHLYYDAHDANGNHYPHFLDGSNNTGVDINWRLFTGGSTITHTWTPTNTQFVTKLESTVRVDAPIFYDRDNTAYYVDANNRSIFNTLNLINGGTGLTSHAALNIGYTGADESRSIDIRGGWSANENKSITFVHGATVNDIVAQINAQHNSPGSRLRWGKLYHGGNSTTYTMELISESTTGAYLTVANSVRSPIFYDSGDTNYYVDPNSETRLYYVSVNVGNETTGGANSSNAGLVLRGNYNSNTWAHKFHKYDNGNGVPLYLSKTVGTGLWTAVQGWGTGLTYDSQVFGSFGSTTVYSSVFYDSDNTAYYVDPTSISKLYGVSIQGSANSTDSGNQIFFWDVDNTTSAIGFKYNGGEFTNPTGNGDGYNTYLTMDGAGRGWVFRRGTGGSNFTAAYTSGWILNNGIWQANDSMRAPIFYDSNNTAYYTDPASTSELNGLNVNAASITLGGDVFRIGEVGSGSNVALGDYVLSNATSTSEFNVGVGQEALRYLGAASDDNTAIGTSALRGPSSGSTGTYNTAVGTYAGYDMTTGSYNSFFGRRAGFDVTSGTYNVFIGANSGYNVTTGARNTIIGSVLGDTTLSDTVIIAAGSTERLRIDSSGNMGFGTTSPSAKFDCYNNSTNGHAVRASAASSHISLVPILGSGGYNSIAQAGDVGIIFSTDNNNSTNASNGLVIAPWGPTLGGIRIQEDGKVGINVSSPADTLEVGGGVRVTGTLTLRGTSPTISLRDTDNRSSHIHANSNYWYVLRGSGNDSAGWTAYDGWWPIQAYMENNDVTLGGNLTVKLTVYQNASDQRLKENIKEIPDALEKIKQIRGVTFDWNDLAYTAGFSPENRYNEIGVIAQEIQAVIPQAVGLAPFDRWRPEPNSNYDSEYVKQRHGTSQSGENYLTVQPEKIIPLLIEAVKEQQKLIEAMQEEINQLKAV